MRLRAILISLIILLQLGFSPIAYGQEIQTYYFSQSLENYSSLEWNITQWNVTNFKTKNGEILVDNSFFGTPNNITKIVLKFNWNEGKNPTDSNLEKIISVYFDDVLTNNSILLHQNSDIGLYGDSGLISGMLPGPNPGEAVLYDTEISFEVPLIIWNSLLYNGSAFFRFGNYSFDYINLTDNMAQVIRVSSSCVGCTPPAYFNQTYYIEKDTGIITLYDLKLQYNFSGHSLYYADIGFVFNKRMATNPRLNVIWLLDILMYTGFIGILSLSIYFTIILFIDFKKYRKIHKESKNSIENYLRLKIASIRRRKEAKNVISDDTLKVIDEILNENKIN